jgi:uncharacterized protein (DUF433 family)
MMQIAMKDKPTSAAAFIRDLDSRAMPRYTLGEAAAYLGLPESTLRAGFVGMPYGKAPNVKLFERILEPASRGRLSFYDIASAHVLMALKAKGVPPSDLREVVGEVAKEFPGSRYPLLGRDFFIFGRFVIIKHVGKRLNLSRSRQLGLRAVMDKFMARIELDANLMPVRFSPLHTHRERGRGYIVIDPDFASGRPTIRGTGIAAEIIAKRKGSGESEAQLAKDYRISRRAVKDAVRYFPTQEAA